MKDLAVNLWDDLRERRLLPVAVALAAALVAVPALLLKGAPEGAQPPLGKQESSSAAMPVVHEDGSSLAGSSKLGAFDKTDPFRPLADLPRDMQPSAGETATGPDGGGAGGGGGDLGGDAGAASGDDPLAAGGGSGSDPAAGASTGGGGRESTGPGGSGSPTRSSADPRFYEYVAEVDFGPIGNERRYRDVRALDMLPNEADPVVVYLGQTRANESAFLVNQAFIHGAKGRKSEGTCIPNTKDCNFVYLRTDNDQDDHYFTERGGKKREFHLKLIAVRRKLETGEASARSRTESAEARTRVEGADKARRTAFDFRIPTIAGQRL